MSILLNTDLPPADSAAESMIMTERKKSSRYFRKTVTGDRIATAVLWISAAITLGILLYILTFIIYRGLRSDNIIESAFLESGSIEIPFTPYGEDSVLIVNEELRLSDISREDLESLLKGKPSNWGNINSQDLKVHPYMLKPAEEDFGENTIIRETPKQVITSTASQSGAMGMVPASSSALSEISGIKIIPVRLMSIGVHPDVLEVKNNIRLRYIDKKILRKILSGEITNWNQASGIDLPIRLILPPQGTFEWAGLAGLTDKTVFAQTALRTESLDEFYLKINTTEGAVALVRNDKAEENNTSLLNYRYRRTERNLRLWFLFEQPKRAGRVGGISSIIVNTIYMVLLTVLFSTPIGIGAAVYLTEYAAQGRLVRLIRLGTETLAGIPSIIFGLFGFIVFVSAMKLGIGLLSGTLTLTLMILPTIIRTSEEAIRSVPLSFRSGSLALGAGKWQTIYKVVLPAAAPGILTGLILAIGRAVGETAALLFTMGFDYRKVKNLSTSARVLSTHLYQLVKEGISFDRAFATATILIAIVLIVNVLSTRLIKRKY